jgi:hypothetical protein
VSWDVEYTDEFSDWWNGLTEDEQNSVAVGIRKLETLGLALGYPHSSQVRGSKHGHMRQLRIQVQGRPFRIFYAFNPERNAVLLIGGDKGALGDDRFYEVYVPPGGLYLRRTSCGTCSGEASPRTTEMMADF